MIGLFSVSKHWCGKEVGMEGEKWMEIRNDGLKGNELHRVREKISHRPADSETVRRIAAAFGGHIVCAKTYKAG